ncbi:MAG: 7-carboxy-7-deazaguanine synthase QueE [Candidatus Omnitrophica bacterium]|nr:7-carboxy-7-deazaguanine synthase QueE [Candidatus Omnitrophota bacterium]
MKARISEIFQSIQGEGKYAGVKQVFVRFYGCNLRCVWCDTAEALGDAPDEFKEMSADEVVSRIDALWNGCHSVSLTGGEPLLQKSFVGAMAPLLKEKNVPLYLETNGVLHEALADVIAYMDIVSMDIKLPSSTRCPPCWPEHEKFLRIAARDKGKDVFVKAVISSRTDQQDMEKAVAIVKDAHPDAWFFIQPDIADTRNGVLKKLRQFQDYALRHLLNVRVMPQMHKILGVK